MSVTGGSPLTGAGKVKLSVPPCSRVTSAIASIVGIRSALSVVAVPLGDHAPVPFTAPLLARHWTAYSVPSSRPVTATGDVTPSTSVNVLSSALATFQRMSRLVMALSLAGSTESATLIESVPVLVTVGAVGASGGSAISRFAMSMLACDPSTSIAMTLESALIAVRRVLLFVGPAAVTEAAEKV